MPRPLQPFAPHPDALGEDFTGASQALQSWLADALPRYRRSPEFKALAKQHQASKGSWFTLFMELNLMYFSGSLLDIDAETTEEILCELLPRKLIVSQDQISGAIPELIACWHWLRRIFARHQALRHADAVIAVLQALEPDYGAVYRGDAPTPACPDTLAPEATPMARLELDRSDDHAAWVEALIDDTKRDTGGAHQHMSPPQAWLMLHTEPLFAQFLEYLLLQGFDAECAATTEAIDTLLRFALQDLHVRLRQDDRDAVAFWDLTEQFIMATGNGQSADPDALALLIDALVPLLHYLSDDFIHFVQQWRQASSAQLASDEAFTADSLNTGLRALLAESEDEFMFLSMIKDQLAFLPADAMAALAETMLDIDDPRINDAVTLLVLDNDSDAGPAVAELLAIRPDTISPTSLGRLIRIRNWLSPEVRKSVDQAVRQARRRGVMPAQIAPLNDADLVEVYASSVDGVGAQGVMLIARTGKQFRLISFVLKEQLGIVDAMVSSPETRGLLQRTVRRARAATGTLQKVSAELIRQQIPIFLAQNQSSAVDLDHELVQAMELIGLDHWNPAALALETLLPEALLRAPSADELKAVQARSARWPQSSLGNCWFEEIDFLQALVDQPYRQQLHTVCQQLLQPARALWRQRMLRMALWAHHADSESRRRQARDFCMVAQLLAQQGPIEEIQLMRAIARYSITQESAPAPNPCGAD